MQQLTVVSLGSLFWIAVALVCSYFVFESKKFTAGFGSACVLEYKNCILNHALLDCVEERGSEQGGDFGSAKSGKPENFRVGLEFGRQSKENLVGEFG